MQRARIRHFVLIGLVVLAALSMFPSLGGGSKSKPAVVPTDRTTRYEATAKPAHAGPAVPAALPRIGTWAER
jgi:hypothetical protein